MNREDIIVAFEELDKNYRLVALRDSYDNNDILGAVYLNKKHNIQDFQNAIYKAKQKREKDISEFGDDWSYISEELTDFDYIEIETDLYEDSVEY